MFTSNTEIFDGFDTDESALALRAFVWGYPLVRSAQLRAKTTRSSPATDSPAMPEAATAPLNAVGHARRLATPATRLGVAPNHDTLYSLAWLDTCAHSFVLEVPDFGQRYYTFQMGQGDTSTDMSLGQRTHGGKLPPIHIYGPRYRGRLAKDHIHISSRHRYLLIAGRIMVNGAEDLPVVHKLQDQISVKTLDSSPACIGTDRLEHMPNPLVLQPHRENGDHRELTYLAQLAAVVRDVSLTDSEARMVHSFQRIGVSMNDDLPYGLLNLPRQEKVIEGLRLGEQAVRRKTFSLGRRVNGWSINYQGPRFGDDYLLRAAVAMDQIYIVEPEEAIYPSARADSQGEILDGRHKYRIRFAPTEIPPVGAFWSITMYFSQGFMVPNPINRWAIGDRTPGLVHDPDRGITIFVQYDPPDPASTANWLPAPRAPFMLLMRLYLPKEPILSGRWVPPPIDRMEMGL
jgi:hypothetical protein